MVPPRGLARRGSFTRVGGCVAGGAAVALVLLGARADSAAAQIPGLPPIVSPFTVVSKLFGKAAEGVGNAVVGGFASLMEYLFDGLINTVTLGFVRWMTRVDLVFSSELKNVVGPVIVIGAFFLLIGLLASSLQAMAAVASGTDTASRAFSAVAMRIGALAVFMAAWFTILPVAVNLANGMSSFMLTDRAVEAALKSSFVVQGTGGFDVSGCGAACGVAPILLLLLLLVVSFTVVVMLILKYVLTFAFAVLYVGGPALIGAGGIPGVGQTAMNMLVRTLGVFIVIPLTWCIVFAAWIGVNAGLARAPGRSQDAVLYNVIDGPGLFAAAMLVLLGVTRKLLKMASPLGAPIGIPGARLLAAAAAYKVGGPALQAMQSKAQGPDRGSAATRAAVAAHNESYNELPYVQTPLSEQRPGGTRTSERLASSKPEHGGRSTKSSTTISTTSGPSASPEAGLGLARERIAGLKAAGEKLDAQSAWDSLNAEERDTVAGAAAQAARQPDPPAAFEDLMARRTAAGAFSNPHAAAVLATAGPGSAQRVASATGGQARPAPTPSEARSHDASAPSSPAAEIRPRKPGAAAPPPDLRTDLEARGRRNEDFVGGADMRLLPPAKPPPPPPPDPSE